MKYLNAADIAALDKQFRTNLINSVPGFKALCLVGTRNEEGVENLAVFNSLFHVGANPPLLGLVCRPDTVDRHTLNNIRINRYYTINQVHDNHTAEAHQTSARYPSHQSEFEATGLHPWYYTDFSAPAVKESAVSMGLHLAEEIPVAANGTVILIGEIDWIALPENAVGADGFVDPLVCHAATVCGLDAYYKATKIARYPYAKPDQELKTL